MTTVSYLFLLKNYSMLMHKYNRIKNILEEIQMYILQLRPTVMNKLDMYLFLFKEKVNKSKNVAENTFIYLYSNKIIEEL